MSFSSRTHEHAPCCSHTCLLSLSHAHLFALTSTPLSLSFSSLTLAADVPRFSALELDSLSLNLPTTQHDLQQKRAFAARRLTCRLIQTTSALESCLYIADNALAVLWWHARLFVPFADHHTDGRNNSIQATLQKVYEDVSVEIQSLRTTVAPVVSGCIPSFGTYLLNELRPRFAP